MSLTIGALAFPDMDQADLTGPFEVLCRLPGSSFLIISQNGRPVCDARGFVITPGLDFAHTPALDVLVVPGGAGVNRLMEDEAALAFVRDRAEAARLVLSVCTGALVCGAAGLLRGKRATTHWASHALLPFFGATAENARVVVDGKFVFAAGVTSGIDAALIAASLLAGEQTAREIQLYMQYAPEPPFESGTPETAPPEVLAALKNTLHDITAEREILARRAAARLGITT